MSQIRSANLSLAVLVCLGALLIFWMRRAAKLDLESGPLERRAGQAG